nr:putative retrotransposon protein [Tanacetum cinerariifolium]
MGYSFYYPYENKIFVAQNVEFLENSLMTKEASRSLEDLEIIQKEDMHPSVNTSLDHDKDNQEIDESQSDINPIYRSTRTRCTPDRMCLYIDSEEHELGDHNEPTNYKAAILDPKSEKCLDAMNKCNHERQQNIRAIRILVVVVTFNDYEIWQMDVKTAFLNGHISEEVYMVQPECFVNPKYPNRTGYVFILNGGVVDRKSTKESIFASLYTEAKYIAAYDTLKEAVWIRKFISGLGFVPTNDEPITIYCDNIGAITIANESGITKGARHYRAKVHYLREVIKLGDVKIEKVHTYDKSSHI